MSLSERLARAKSGKEPVAPEPPVPAPEVAPPVDSVLPVWQAPQVPGPDLGPPPAAVAMSAAPAVAMPAAPPVASPSAAEARVEPTDHAAADWLPAPPIAGSPSPIEPAPAAAPAPPALALDDLEAALREAVMKHARGAQMVLILDACFSGRSESETAVADARGRVLSPESSAGGPLRFAPRKASDEIIVLAAARDDEIASWDREAPCALAHRPPRRSRLQAHTHLGPHGLGQTPGTELVEHDQRVGMLQRSLGVAIDIDVTIQVGAGHHHDQRLPRRGRRPRGDRGCRAPGVQRDQQVGALAVPLRQHRHRIIRRQKLCPARRGVPVAAVRRRHGWRHERDVGANHRCTQPRPSRPTP